MLSFFHLPPTLSHLSPLQVENCDSNLQLVVDEDENGKFRLERVKGQPVIYSVVIFIGIFWLIRIVWKAQMILCRWSEPGSTLSWTRHSWGMMFWKTGSRRWETLDQIYQGFRNLSQDVPGSNWNGIFPFLNRLPFFSWMLTVFSGILFFRIKNYIFVNL